MSPRSGPVADRGRVDVLVVGAGPAGLSAARAAASEGASVLLVDAKAEIGLPVRCAEYVPCLAARDVEIPAEAIAQDVEGMVVTCGGVPLGRVRSPGFILHKKRFEKHLVQLAASAGAEVLLGTRAAPAGEGRVALARRDGRVTRVEAKVVVAADGSRSAFRDGGAPAPRCLPAMQALVRLAGPLEWTDVRFERRFRAGYAWLFPKGDLANAGVGCAPVGGRRELPSVLEGFLDHLIREGRVSADPPLGRTGGWIPIWGPPASAVDLDCACPVLFAGDAGGFTDPVTGAGIWAAAVTGRMAGRRAAEYARGGGPAGLSAYDEDWRGLLGAALARSAASRRRMDSEWDSADLDALVRSVWPGLGSCGVRGERSATEL